MRQGTRQGPRRGRPARAGLAALAAALAVAAALAAPTEALAGGAKLYRLYNPYDGQHLLTRDAAEYESLQPLGWRGEGVAFHAAHTHAWEPVYQSTWVQDSAAWDEPVYSTVVKYRCSVCGKLFDSVLEWSDHDIDVHNGESSYSDVAVKVQTGTTHHDATGHYEQVVMGYRCTGCGATR